MLNNRFEGLALEPSYPTSEIFTRTMGLQQAMRLPGVAALLNEEGCSGNTVEITFEETPQGAFPIEVYSWVE